MHVTKFPKASWIITVHGATDGSNKTGAPTLVNDFFVTSTNTVTSIRIPKGLKLRILDLEFLCGGYMTDWRIDYTLDITAGSPTWVPILDNANVQRLYSKMQKLVVGPSLDGKLAIRFFWTQVTQDDDSKVNATIELYEDKDE